MGKYFLFLVLLVLFPCKISAGNRSVSFESYIMPGWYLGIKDEHVTLLTVCTETDKEYTTFTIVPGLAKDIYISIQSATDTDYYLRHQNGVIKLHEYSTWHSYKKECTFKMERGIADINNKNLVSFGVYTHPGMFICYRNGKFQIEESEGSKFSKNNATFIIRPPNWDGKVKLTKKRTGEKSLTKSRKASLAVFIYCIALVISVVVIIMVNTYKKNRISRLQRKTG